MITEIPSDFALLIKARADSLTCVTLLGVELTEAD
jgi:hypothetical protein